MIKTAPTPHQLKNFTALRRHLHMLATLPVTDAPVLSAFFDFRQPLPKLRNDYLSWLALARTALRQDERPAFDAAAREIEMVLIQEWPSTVHSIAVFARASDSPLLQVLPFAAHLETSFSASSMPVIFPLVQMKDRFHRFVVAISNEDQARVLEISLGAVSEQILASRPEMKKRIGREWTQEHYHQHKRESDRRFAKEQVAIISDLMAKRGHNHLILAGTPHAVAALRAALPKNLQDRVVNSLFGTSRLADSSSVLEEAVAAFIAVEQGESRNAVEMLYDRVRSNGLAVMGIHRCLDAMKSGAASALVISEELPAEDREQLVRLATSHELPIEVCENDELLDSHGGVGCLLRYKAQAF